jgi:rhamnose transport system permease protein
MTQELLLVALLAAEVLLFSAIGKNFATTANALEIVRLSAEVGLIAIALTPVIISGGIDLSVGSLMGLSAVIFGMLWRAPSIAIPIPIAALLTLLLGALAGLLNGVLITRLRLPPLIVTLGTFSLFRGLAEGMTRGVENYTSFPSSFLFLGQGYMLGGIPTQLPLFAAIAAAFWWLMQQTATGRALFAIGLSPEGAHYAGIPVERKLLLVYLLSGLTVSAAAIIYVAHLGQAKADAGTGYELMAITAVVLGGTSIFGGRGTVHGTLLGLFAIVVLQNGLRLAALPAELAGILIGTILLVTIAIERLASIAASRSQSLVEWDKPAAAGAGPPSEDFEVKNSQVAVICGVILLAALIVAGSNILAVQSLIGRTAAPRLNPVIDGPGSRTVTKALTIAMMPKNKGNAYFIACRKGAEEAAKELGIELIWDGPTDTDPAKQNEIVEAWITRGVDAIAVAVENRVGISSVLRKARERGIKVITWDADAEPDARDFLVNQATPQGIGTTLMDHAGRILGGKGEFAIITASLTAANQIEWQKYIEARRAEKFPDVKMAVLRACDDKQDRAFDEANTILNAYPNVKLLMAICSPAVPGAAEAVKQSRRSNVKVIGLGLPNDNKPYVKSGITDAVILWNTMDLGYLTVYAAKAVSEGRLKAGDSSLAAGRLGKVEVAGDNVLLGQPLTFTKDNIDQFDF